MNTNKNDQLQSADRGEACQSKETIFLMQGRADGSAPLRKRENRVMDAMFSAPLAGRIFLFSLVLDQLLESIPLRMFLCLSTPPDRTH